MDVLIVGDTGRTPELRHEVPLAILDPFVYVEAGGRRIVAISGMEAPRIDALGIDLEPRPLQEFGADELRRSGLDEYELMNQLTLRVVRELGVRHAVVPRGFPVAVADVLRADGVELTVDQSVFDGRRRAKSDHELAGIRRAQKASEEALTAAVDLLRRSEPANGGRRVVDGTLLTCELLKERIQSVLVAGGAFAPEIIASHGPQTAVGHDKGSGPIARDDVVLIDLFPVDLESACFADMTRTFALGDVSEEWHASYRLCKDALDLAVANVRPGADGAALHRQTCKLFAEHGHPTTATKKEGEVLRDGFNHALGHGVGLAEHESPWIGTIGEELAACDVIALEPALYRSGTGGIRIEDLILVTEDGCELLSHFPYEFAIAP